MFFRALAARAEILCGRDMPRSSGQNRVGSCCAVQQQSNILHINQTIFQ